MITYPYKEMTNVKEEITRERFKRLATLRTNEVLKKLKILGNCANRNAYEYTEEDIKKIFSVIDKKLNEIKAKFQFSNNEHKEFKL